jgi:cell division protein FtsI/penicillin-binding protein 2
VSRRIWIPLVVVVVLIAAAVPAGLLFLKHRDEKARTAAVASFTQAWKGGTLAGLTFANGQGPAVAADFQKATGGLTAAAKDSPTAVTIKSTTVKGKSLTAALQVTWTLSGGRSWSYPTSVTFTKTGGSWKPDYQPGVIHPKLVAGAVLKATTTPAARGEIIGADGNALVSERPVVVVGMERSLTDDVDASAAKIGQLTGIDGAALAKRVKAAGKTTFVQAIILRQAAYDEVSAALHPVPGAVFQKTSLALAPTPEFARALIGSVGVATADSVKASKGRVKAGDITGLSGLQLAYDEQLSGTPGLKVQLVPEGNAAAETLFSAPAVNGKPLKITLDEKFQKAADKALLDAKKPAALVAIQVSTGKVLAVANGGPNASGYNRALLGQYPPGSTFKVASTLALLGAGITPTSTVQCPATINVDGRNFKNSEAEEFGAASFRTDFANSCNTAFIGSAGKITAKQLTKAAKTLGYGQPDKLGVTAFMGSVPVTDSDVEHAASMIGQAKVLASPLVVAGASASVAAGRSITPQLVLTGSEIPPGAELPGNAEKDLKSLMRSVVTEGTGVPIKSVAGGDVYGKTGTAEYGNDKPPKTHAWFTGFQGDVAFAAVVEDGGFGAKAALPLIKKFLTILAGQ